MYSTCLFCKLPLGRNEILEEFPVGRRVAFDGGRGRLWVVCRACERWNLSPLEERWEVIEECERLYSGTRLRVSTENIGLARCSEGLELVRIGSPQRPEMAAWRYGDQFGRRRKRAMWTSGLALGAFGLVVAGGAAVGVGVMAFGGMYGGIVDRIIKGDPKKVVATVPGEHGEPLPVRRKDAERMKLIRMGGPGAGGEWRLEVTVKKLELVYAGDAAVRAAAGILPGMNRYGGTRKHVEGAVGFLERSGGVEATFREAAAVAVGKKGKVDKLPYEVRLAMEMAAHEEAERRALEGELAELERSWKEAEEIAEISDNLLMPSSVDDWIRRIRGA
jgi:hypothetical protein